MGLLAALLLLLLACANYLLHRDVLYPGFLQASLWCLTVSLLLCCQKTFLPISDGVYVLLTAGVSLFSMGAFLGSYRHRPWRMRNHVREGTLPGKGAVGVLVALVTVGLVL